MFSFDAFNRPEPVSIFLCRPDDSVVCELNGIDESTAQLKITLNNQAELTFDYKRYIADLNGNLVESNGYHSLNVDMQLLVTGLGFFRMKYPPMKWDGESETKTITAYSCECELEDKDLVDFKINTGEDDSLEYLVTYDDDETEELLSSYTGLPYDYITFDNTYPAQLEELLNKYADGSTITDKDSIEEITSYCSLIPRLKRRTYTETATDSNGNESQSTSLTEYVEYTYDASGESVISIYLFDGFNARISELITFYTKYHDQLSLIPLAIENCLCNWTVGSIDPALSNKKYQFDVDGENIYSFLTNTVAQTCECVFVFDLFYRIINVVLVENIGVDSGVFIDKANLMNTLDVSCETDSLYTRYSVYGGNDIDIKYVNFGSPRIDDITFFIYARDEDGNRIYMTDTLAEKYLQFIADRDAARSYYITYTKTYNQLISDIDELKYRVPDDALEETYDDYSQEELDGLLTVYNNLLATLKTLYKEQYGSAGCNADGSINETYMKTTEYWYDYYAYVHTIEMIEVAIYAQGYYTTSDDEDIIAYYEGLGYDITGWETEWSLYGTVELQAKIDSYTNNMQALSDAQAVLLDDNGVAIPWNSLTSTQKAEYGGTTDTTTESEDYITLEIDYKYDEYMEYYNLRTSAQEYLDGLLQELADMEAEQAEAQANRQALLPLITLAGYDRTELGKLVELEDSDVSGTFTAAEIQTITRLYIDKTYSNEYILTTSLDTTVTTVDVEYELLEDAQEELSKDAQPQISFATDLDNLMAMPEFKDFDFSVGNYVTVKYYDDYYVTLRLYSMTFNPCIPEDSLSVTFTNFIKSQSKRSDLSYILDNVSGSGSSSSSSSSSGSGSTFGDSDDIDVTISNTMLSKLLNTEMFGTRVTDIILDTIQANTLTARYASFGGLAKGTTIIDGKCIRTGYILSTNYNGTENKTHLDEDGNETSETTVTYELDGDLGSIFVLETGEFSLAGGRLKYIIDEAGDATLYVDCKITWNNITTDTDGQTLEDYISGAISDAGVDTSGFITCSAAGRLLQGGTEITGYYITSPNIVGGDIKIGSASGIYFHVDSDGKLTAQQAIIDGTLTAASGSKIGPWVVEDNCVYNGKSSIDYAANGVYIGTDGISLGASTAFKVTSSGILNATSAVISGTLTAGANSKIGPWTVSSTAIYYDSKSTYTSTSSGIYIGTSGIALGTNNPFTVSSGGELTAQKATITGTVYANAGSIGDWTISGDRTGYYTGICSVGSSLAYNVYLCQGLNEYNDVIVARDMKYTSYYPLVLKATGEVLCKNIIVTGAPDTTGSEIKVDQILPYSSDSLTIGDAGNMISCGVWAETMTIASSKATDGVYGTYFIGTGTYTCSLAVTGDMSVSGSISGTVSTSSDERFKTDWIDISEYDRFFDLLQPKGFKYTVGLDTSKYHLGFGAQTVQSALTECGLTEEDFAGLMYRNDEYSLSYIEFIALLVDQVQKLKTRVSSLENKILALES